MTDIVDRARAHYAATGLTDRLRQALLPLAPEDQRLGIADLAAMDQFHTRGMLATKDLAVMAGVDANMRVLDLGCGVGGPARYLAATHGCHVTGVDLSESFVAAATYLSARCGLQDRVSFKVGNALALAFEAGSFDLVFLQHVAMNIQDRAGLYAEIARVLTPGGGLATYDIILKAGDAHYPMPWARDAAASFLLTEGQTRAALVAAGLEPAEWRDDSAVAVAWFAAAAAGAPPSGLSLGVVMGPDFPALAGNLGRNLREGRLGVLSAVARRR